MGIFDSKSSSTVNKTTKNTALNSNVQGNDGGYVFSNVSGKITLSDRDAISEALDFAGEALEKIGASNSAANSQVSSFIGKEGRTPETDTIQIVIVVAGIAAVALIAFTK